MRELLRRVEMKVIYENHLDAIVRLHYSLPPGKIGLAPQPEPPSDTRGELRMGPFAGLTESLFLPVCANGLRSVFVLSADKKRYIPTNNNKPTTLPPPGLPFSLGLSGGARKGRHHFEDSLGLRSGFQTPYLPA